MNLAAYPILAAPAPAPAPTSPPPPAGGMDLSGVTNYLETNVVGVVVLVIGIIVLLLARKKDLGNAATVVAGVLLGLLVIGLSHNGNSISVGSWLAHTVFG